MGSASKIEWCDSTFNPWTGCTKVSIAAKGGGGCDHCYAEAWSKRAGPNVGKWEPGSPRVLTSPVNWRQPSKWNAEPFIECMVCRWRGEAREAALKSNLPGFDRDPGAMRICPRCKEPMLKGARRRVFCASLADVFDNQADPAWRVKLLQLIADTPNLDWLLLTKRVGNAHAMLDEALSVLSHGLTRWADYPWSNVWIGATVVTQAEADRDIPKLLAVPARVRFLSLEPLLGPVDLNINWPDGSKVNTLTRSGNGLDWVIAGGESGPGARPMHPDWARSLRDQCDAAGVQFLFKQWGEWTPGENVERQRGTVDTAFLWNGDWHIHPLNLATDHGHIDDEPDLYRVGKKAAGRLLDGVEHNGFPEVA